MRIDSNGEILFPKKRPLPEPEPEATLVGYVIMWTFIIGIFYLVRWVGE